MDAFKVLLERMGIGACSQWRKVQQQLEDESAFRGLDKIDRLAVYAATPHTAANPYTPLCKNTAARVRVAAATRSTCEHSRPRTSRGGSATSG